MRPYHRMTCKPIERVMQNSSSSIDHLIKNKSGEVVVKRGGSMWSEDFPTQGSMHGGTDTRPPHSEQTQRMQQSLWYLLAVIALAEMLFGAWAVGLLRH